MERSYSKDLKSLEIHARKANNKAQKRRRKILIGNTN